MVLYSLIGYRAGLYTYVPLLLSEHAVLMPSECLVYHALNHGLLHAQAISSTRPIPTPQDLRRRIVRIVLARWQFYRQHTNPPLGSAGNMPKILSVRLAGIRGRADPIVGNIAV